MLTVTYKTCISDSMGKYGTSLYEKGIIFSISKTKKKNLKVESHDYKQSKEGNTLGFMPAILLVALTLNPFWNHQLRQQSPKFASEASGS